jgi:hypothetical protein
MEPKPANRADSEGFLTMGTIPALSRESITAMTLMGFPLNSFIKSWDIVMIRFYRSGCSRSQG